jgi:hypothetical protein
MIQEGIEQAQESGIAITMAAFVVVPPFCEEIFFRGILYRGLRNRFGIGVALAGTTILFAAVPSDGRPEVPDALRGRVFRIAGVPDRQPLGGDPRPRR